MKKRYNFTLDEDVMEWLKYYCKENRTNCSSFINQTLGKMKGGSTPKAKMPSIPTKFNWRTTINFLNL